MVLAKVYQVALATYRAACQRRPGLPITYVAGSAPAASVCLAPPANAILRGTRS
jgi:hypothetical protein